MPARQRAEVYWRRRSALGWRRAAIDARRAPDDDQRRSSEDGETDTAGVGCTACVEQRRKAARGCGSLLAGIGVACATVAVCSGP